MGRKRRNRYKRQRAAIRKARRGERMIASVNKGDEVWMVTVTAAAGFPIANGGRKTEYTSAKLRLRRQCNVTDEVLVLVPVSCSSPLVLGRKVAQFLIDKQKRVCLGS